MSGIMSDLLPQFYLFGFMWFWLSEYFFDVELWRSNPTRSQFVQIFASMLWPLSVPARYLYMRLLGNKKAREDKP